MEPLLDLPIDQFFGALDELGLDPERRSDLLREYRRRNSAFSPVYGLLDSVADEDAAAGMQRADIVPISRPEGMSVFEAIRSGDWRLAVPQGALDAVGGVAGALDVPAAAASGLIPREDMVGEALNAAGAVMGLGGLLARPAGSLGTGGRVVDLSERRQQQARDDFANRIQSVVDDVASGNYQRRLDEAAFAAHREGLLPLPMGTRVAPPDANEMPGSWQVSGYFVDPNNPRRFGYRLESDSGDTFDAVVSDPRIGYRLDDPTRFGGGFRAFAGPRGEALQYRNLPQAPQPAPSRAIDPDEQARIDEEYRQLFGDELSANRSTTTGLLAAASAETPAQQVARLLREGRSDEVTDDIMEQADPQEMYQLYVSGETGMDLAMDEASRMARAREMGFDTDAPLYHGTNFDFRNFFQNPEVRRFDNRASRRGTWFSTNPDDAEFYGETIYPVFVSGRYQNLPSMEEMGADVVDRLMSIRPQNIETDLAAEEFVDFLRSAKPPGFYTDVAGTRMSQAQRQGFDGVRLIGGETVQQISEPGDNVAVFDPRNIRSRFARFDPRLSHLSNLNAANIDPLTGAAAMGASQQQDPLASLRAYLAQNGLLSQ